MCLCIIIGFCYTARTIFTTKVWEPVLKMDFQKPASLLFLSQICARFSQAFFSFAFVIWWKGHSIWMVYLGGDGSIIGLISHIWTRNGGGAPDETHLQWQNCEKKSFLRKSVISLGQYWPCLHELSKKGVNCTPVPYADLLAQYFRNGQ